MWAFLLALLELLSPTLDLADDVLFAGHTRPLVGCVIVNSNEVTDFSAVTDLTLIYSGDTIRPWKFVVSEWLLLSRHYDKFDLIEGKRPRIHLLEEEQPSEVRDVVIEFCEKNTDKGR
ncbi:MAG TPA: hypothetical protein VKI65_00875 [Gemmataceae bacterium]|nr:hypothetical protein [Gemmataceae bacterium]